MDSKAIEQLLGAKKLHVDVAKKNLSMAHLHLSEIEQNILALQSQLALMKQNSVKKRQEALQKALAGNVNTATHKVVCNVYTMIDEEILLHNKKIWSEERAKRAAIEMVSKAQQKLNRCLQKEQKIQHVADSLEQEKLVRDELISENTEQ